MSNRLSLETSPYLLQHQNNPVDWYPWGEEALELSVEQNKPILLSIGYSACHWCHVMEHESFENAEIANLMNRNFICIKVDREERPDLDHIYQNVAQALTQSGGWPLTVFLTPARKPFFGGTYFPPEDRHGRAGLKRVLVQLAKAYATDPMGVAKNAMKLSAYIDAAESVSGKADGPKESQDKLPDWDLLAQSTELLLRQVDWQNGGIGGAPKFPNPMVFSFLWRFGVLRNHESAKEAVLLTLRKMAEGGIYDHLGGGFSRYSVDATWSVPHFEKMLYDNASLLKLYSEVLLTDESVITPEDRELFTGVVRETVQYLHREMKSPEGGFYAAQDADSEGEEGKFFAWDGSDLESAIANEEDRKIFELRYGITDSGNFEHGKTVIYLAKTIEEVASELSLDSKKVLESLKRSRETLFKIRDARIHPGTDNKILTAWNGLLMSGLSWAAQALKSEGFDKDAEVALVDAHGAFKLVCDQLASGEDARLFSTFQGGKGKLNGYLDDYAFMIMGALDLQRFGGDSVPFAKIEKMTSLWMKRIIRRFKDDKGGAGYFFTSDDHEELIQRPKTVFDQAIPSGTAVALECLMILSETDSENGSDWTKEWTSQLVKLVGHARTNPYGCGELLNAGLLQLIGPVVVSGTGSTEVTGNPFVFRKSGSQLLVCHRQTCDAPVPTIEKLAETVQKKLIQK